LSVQDQFEEQTQVEDESSSVRSQALRQYGIAANSMVEFRLASTRRLKELLIKAGEIERKAKRESKESQASKARTKSAFTG
jgi:hypothetical protein